MQDFSVRLIARATPVPDVSDQVAGELKDAVDTARETAKSVAVQLPVIITDIAIAVAVIIGALLLVRIARFVISKVIRPGRRQKNGAPSRVETTRTIVSSIFSYVIYFIAICIVLGIFGVNVSSIFTAVGVIGIAISFGAQTLVKDIISGLFLWGEGNLTVGDLVNINDLSGTVEAVTLRTTTIRNWNGNVHVIPNGDIRAITNMTRGFKRAIVNIPCPYEANHEAVVAMIREEMAAAVQDIPGIESVPDVMSIVSFDTNAVMVQIAVACPVGEHWRIERDIRTRIKARFDREGILMPHYSVPPQSGK